MLFRSDIIGTKTQYNVSVTGLGVVVPNWKKRAHLDLYRLHVQVTGRFEGFGSRGVQVGAEGSQGSHAQECVGGQAPHILPELF